MTYDVGFVGTGPDPDDPGRDGYAMAYRHASGYQRLDDCRLSACTDLVRPRAERFAAEFGVPHVYDDYETMLWQAEPDVVSVCVPPAHHAEIVVGAAETGIPEAIHCEKPMAATWEECKEMVRVCEDNGVRLTFDHQRRFARPVRAAKRLLDDGAIGDLRRIELSGDNLYDFGSHLFDLAGYFVDQSPPEWVMAQIDYSEENVWHGAHNENRALANWKYEDGTFGLAATGDSGFVDSMVRLVGSDGVVELGPEETPPDRPLRVRPRGAAEWHVVDTGLDGMHGPVGPKWGLLGRGIQKLGGLLPGVSEDFLTPPSYVDRAVAEVIRTLREGEPSTLDARNALQATEVIFACWESARRRGRVELPLEIEDNPLEAMVDAGQLRPRPR